MLIFRRSNYIITASVIVTLCKRLYSTPVESRLYRVCSQQVYIMMHSQKNTKPIILIASFLVYKFTGVDKSRFTVVRMEKYMQVMIITKALLTQKNVTMAQCT